MRLINWFGKQIKHERLSDSFIFEETGFGPSFNLSTERITRMVPEGDQLYRKQDLWRATISTGYRKRKDISTVEHPDLYEAMREAVNEYIKWRKGQ